MTIQTFLDSLRGEQRMGEFAKQIGISHRMLNAIYAGERFPGRKTLRGLLRAYPQHRDEILALLFLPGSAHHGSFGALKCGDVEGNYDMQGARGSPGAV